MGEIIGLLRAMSERQTGLEYLETILRYVASSAERVSEEELRQVVIEVIEEGGTLMPTLVEQWLERGRQEGREEGLEQGRWEAALTMLRRFLVRRFGAIPEPLGKALRELDLAELTELSDVAFEAESLAAVETALVKLKSGDETRTAGSKGN